VAAPPNPSRYSYDPRSKRYRDLVTGQYVSAAQVRGAVDYVINAVSDKLRAISQLLIDGSISVGDWQTQIAGLLKNLNTAMGMAAYGGISGMSDANTAALSTAIEKQLAFLQNFAQQIASGKQALDGTLLARIELYAEASRGTYENAVRELAMADPNLTEEQRILGVADHCDDCVEAADHWEPIGTLPDIGDSACMARCHCSFEYK
jgi:hypothetical protein